MYHLHGKTSQFIHKWMNEVRNKECILMQAINKSYVLENLKKKILFCINSYIDNAFCANNCVILQP
jgi:hypothetical protein